MKISFNIVIETQEEELKTQYSKHDTFAYAIEDRGVDVATLERVRQEYGVTMEEFAEMLEKAFLAERHPIERNEANPYCLMKEGNHRKARCEVRD